MELKLSGRIAEDLARERHRELLERSLKQARLALKAVATPGLAVRDPAGGS